MSGRQKLTTSTSSMPEGGAGVVGGLGTASDRCFFSAVLPHFDKCHNFFCISILIFHVEHRSNLHQFGRCDVKKPWTAQYSSVIEGNALGPNVPNPPCDFADTHA